MSTITEQLRKSKVIPVIAVDRAEDIIPLGNALYENGLPAAEITFRTAAAQEAIRTFRDCSFAEWGRVSCIQNLG